jgi:hypothetical protein
MRRGVLASLVSLLACGSDHHNNPMPDAPTPDAAGFVTAPHTPLPMLDRHSGAILSNVQLVTLTYTGYGAKSGVEAFGDYVVTSPWFTGVAGEYGVMAGTHAAKVDIGPPPATLKDTDIPTLVQSLVNTGKVPAPPTTGNQYLYMLYVPPTITLDASLQGFYGYHDMTSVTITGQTVYIPFAVILDDGTGLSTTTSTAAHELVEAATDTLFVVDQNGDGYWADRMLPDPWYLVETEAADLCDGEALIQAGSFTVQRIWSNQAIAAGKSPCVPYDPDDLWYDVSADPPMMPVIPKGGMTTFTLTGWSTAATSDWQLSTATADFSDLTSQQMAPQLSDRMINNGRTVTLTLHAPSTATSGQLGGVYVMSGPQQRPWVVGFSVQ